ncbi:MAG: small ribosomal subunit Rsm22 family protein [Bacteriovoracaceae bacterium]|nr:small ribosomal subunit Rsm22 family protein [Bacteriovoracaceae bacterium]
MKLSDLYPHLLYQFASEADLVKAIGEISTAFTTERHKIDQYLKDPRLVSAYTAFYLTTNIPKLEAVMNFLSIEKREELKNVQLIDVGAGPGTFSLAWKELIGGESVMLESSALMREQAKKLMSGLYGIEAQFKVTDAAKPKLLLFGHSLNEMGVEAGLKYIKENNPQYVWLIEPGTKEVFQMALEFREEMLKLNWEIQYPCLGNSKCPMNGSEDWCHQFISVRHNEEVERLTQLAHRDRRNLPLTVFMFERKKVNHKNSEARIVRVMPKTKFSHEWVVCLNDENLKLEKFQLPFKLNSKSEKKSIEALLAGCLIEFETDKSLEGYRRIRLISPE